MDKESGANKLGAKQEQPKAFPSGLEVVTNFIEEMKTQTDLNHDTVLTIAKLYQDNKLSANNLLNGLEEMRRKPGDKI